MATSEHLFRAAKHAIAGLKPESLWEHFAGLTQIARPSKHEGLVRSHITAWAESLGLEHKIDSNIGNLLIRVRASHGRERAPTVVLQGHLDIVCERDPTSPYDPLKGQILLMKEQDAEGEWIRAVGTTLGADNGIGLAAMMAIGANKNLPHGPLEMLFTVDEETGLNGAAGLRHDFLGGRILLNLDSEDEGALCIGSAGGCDTLIRWRGSHGPVDPTWPCFAIELHGLSGGHSGTDIRYPSETLWTNGLPKRTENRANAIRLLTRFLRELHKDIPIRLAWILGGNLTNAIPRECKVIVFVAPSHVRAFEQFIEGRGQQLKNRYQTQEPTLELRFGETDSRGMHGIIRGRAFELDATRAIIGLLSSLPTGVLAVRKDMPESIQSSTNLGTVSSAGGTVDIGLCSRSLWADVERKQRSPGPVIERWRAQLSDLDDVLDDIIATANRYHVADCDIKEVDRYPGWAPDPLSPVLRVMKQVYLRRLGFEPHVIAIHGGLECGFIRQRIPDMDMVSFGPDIRAAHSPNERVRVDSVANFWKALVDGLNELSSPAMIMKGRHIPGVASPRPATNSERRRSYG